MSEFIYQIKYLGRNNMRFHAILSAFILPLLKSLRTIYLVTFVPLFIYVINNFDDNLMAVIILMLIEFILETLIALFGTISDVKKSKLDSNSNLNFNLKLFKLNDINESKRTEFVEDLVKLQDFWNHYGGVSYFLHILEELTTAILLLVYYLVILIVYPALLLLILVFMIPKIVYAKAAYKYSEDYSNRSYETLGNIFDVQGFLSNKKNSLYTNYYDMQPKLEKKIKSNFSKSMNFIKRSMILTQKKFLKLSIFDLIESVLFYVLLFDLVRKDAVTIEEVLLLNIVFFAFLGTIKNIMGKVSDLKLNTQTIKLIQKYDDLDKQYKERKFNTSIKFENASFKYNDEKSGFNDLNLDFDMNKKYMVIGRSGAGKTTMLKMILKNIDASSGGLKYDSLDDKSMTTRNVYENLVVVNQESNLLFADIKTNFNLTKKNIDLYRKLCDEFNLDSYFKDEKNLVRDFISTSRQISGGEKQKLLLIRAILQNKKFAIFDEITSNLDVLAEKTVYKLLNKYFTGFILVSHRLSNVFYVDNVILIDNFEVVCKGTHKENLKVSELYNELFKEDDDEANN